MQICDYSFFYVKSHANLMNTSSNDKKIKSGSWTSDLEIVSNKHVYMFWEDSLYVALSSMWKDV